MKFITFIVSAVFTYCFSLLKCESQPSTDKQSQITGQVGETVVLKCKLFGNSNRGRWIKGDQVYADRRIGNVTHRIQIIGSINDNEFNLQIKNLTSQDQGTYRCITKNETRAYFTDFQLVVIDRSGNNTSLYTTTERESIIDVGTQVNSGFTQETLTVSIIFIVLTTLVNLVATFINMFVTRQLQKDATNFAMPTNLSHFIDPSYNTGQTYNRIEENMPSSFNGDVIENRISIENISDNTKVKEVPRREGFTKRTSINTYQALQTNVNFVENIYNQLGQ